MASQKENAQCDKKRDQEKRGSTFGGIFKAYVDDKIHKSLKKFLIGENLILLGGVVVMLAKVFDFNRTSRNFFLSSVAVAVISMMFVVPHKLQYGTYVILRYTLYLSLFLLAYGVTAIIASNSEMLWLVLIVFGVVHFLMVCSSYVLVAGFWRTTRSFGVFCLVLAVIFHGLAIEPLVHAVVRGGFHFEW